MANDETNDRPTTDSAKGPGRRWIVIGVAVAVVVLIAGGVWALVARDDDTPTYGTAQIGWMHQGCQQWAEGYEGANGPTREWCTSMTDWMNNRTGSNQPSGDRMMAGSMMWQDPTSMQATCEQWMASDRSDVSGDADTGRWCTEMVDWMDQRLGGWDTWMRNGPMMDGG